MKSTLRPALLLLTILALANGAKADPLSAAAAEAALHQGALAWDVRAQGASLPGALRVDAAALDQWLAQRDVPALAVAVSRAGLDLSRDIVVYGEAGDARAQALVDSLQALASGRVHWLVGGVAEWAMTGRELREAPGNGRLPVPQVLVSQDATGPKTMASASLRTPQDGLMLLTAAR